MDYKYEVSYLTEKDSQVQALSVVTGADYTGKWKPAYNAKEKIALVPLMGHVLVGLEPQEYGDQYKGWGENAINVFPEEYKLKPSNTAGHILETAVEHLKNSRKIIIATDYDNEGASIAMNVIRYAGAEDRVERMLPMGSTHPEELRSAIDNPIDIPYLNMADAGMARAFIDWAEGMSLSRALTYFLGDKGKAKLNFGGVKTPLIYMVVERDTSFEAHEMSYFWTISGYAMFNGKQIPVKLKHKTMVLNKANKEVPKFVDKFDSQEEAEEALAYLSGKEFKVKSITRKKASETPPLLYELAGLQEDMIKKHGTLPSGTMDIGQKLYDFPVSLQSYPRTDIPYLKSKEYNDVVPILTKLGASGIVDKTIIETILAGDIPKRNTTFNDKEVIAHGAIVPTLKGDIDKWIPKLSESEKSAFEFVSKRYTANFMEDYLFEDISGETVEDNGFKFSFSENVPLSAGWKELYDSDINNKINSYERIIPAELTNGADLTFEELSHKRGETKPKPLFTMATLLKAMKSIASLFPGNQEIKEFLGDSGIGTNATRAGIIDNVMSEKFNKGAPWLEDVKKKIKSTTKAREFINVMPIQLVSPIKRAMLNKKLKLVEKGELSAKDLINEYREEVNNNIEIIKDIHAKNGPIAAAKEMQAISLGECPKCGKDIIEKDKLFLCSGADFHKDESTGEWSNNGCDYKIFKGGLKKLGKNNITAKEVSNLLHKGKVVVSLKSLKNGKAYNGDMVVDLKWGVKINFNFK